jgi:hypothetical protein
MDSSPSAFANVRETAFTAKVSSPPQKRVAERRLLEQKRVAPLRKDLPH